MEQAGLTVRTLSGWETRGGSWRLRDPFRTRILTNQPVGVMHHHTAPPVPYPIGALVGSKLKANMNIKPDGTVWLLAYRACNYSSGMGSSVVLNEVLKGVIPSGLARDRGLRDNVNGNPYYWNSENDHWGNGSSIPQIQLDAIVVATQVVQHHFTLPITAAISHGEHTARKIDPRWNGKDAHETLNEIRSLLMEGPMPKEPLRDWARDSFQWAIDNGFYTEKTKLSEVREAYDIQQMVVMMHRIALAGGSSGLTVGQGDDRYIRRGEAVRIN